MAVHQMQRHLKLSQQCGRPPRAAFRILQGEYLCLLALDPLAHLNDQSIDLCKLSVSITDPRQTTTAPVRDLAAKAINEQLIIGL